MTDQIRRVSVAQAFAAHETTPPFRLAATSFVIPDSVRANCLHLQEYFPEVGLVLFELGGCLAYGPEDWPETSPNVPSSDPPSNVQHKDLQRASQGVSQGDRPSTSPSLQMVDRYLSNAAQGKLDYHLHLPLDLPWQRGIDMVWQGLSALLERTAPLRPRAYVLHPPPAPALLEPLAERFARSGVDVADVLLENIREDDLTGTWKVARPLGYGLCLDIGHVLSYGQGDTLAMDGMEGRVGMIHAYAPVRGSGHASLALLDQMPNGHEVLDRALKLLRPGGTVTLEVFREAELFESLEWLAAYLAAQK